MWDSEQDDETEHVLPTFRDSTRETGLVGYRVPRANAGASRYAL